MSSRLDAYPSAEINPFTFRVSAALAGAGAWDATPLIADVATFEKVTLFFAYTRGGAAGAFDFEIFVSPFNANRTLPLQSWYSQALYDPAAVAAGTDSQSRLQREYLTYQATGATAETFIYGPISLPYANRIFVQARESGNVGAPGTLEIVGLLTW